MLKMSIFDHVFGVVESVDPRAASSSAQHGGEVRVAARGSSFTLFRGL